MDSQSRATEQAPYEIDVAPDGDRWRYRKRWRQGLRRFLPSLWHATDEMADPAQVAGLALLFDESLAVGGVERYKARFLLDAPAR